MDGGVHIGQVVQVVLDAGDLLCVRQQSLHLGFGATVTKFEVVQHRIVLFGKALIGVLDILHVGAHLVGVVRHISQGHVGNLGGCGGITAQTLQQAGRKPGHGFHVVVGRKSRRLPCVLRISLDGVGVILEQGFHTA